MIILTSASQIDSYVQFMTVLFIFLFVLLITYFVTKWIAKVQKVQVAGGNIEVIETSKISSNQYIQIVRVGEKYLAIALSKDSVTMLTEVPEDTVKKCLTANEKMDFSEVLKSIKNSNPFEKKHTDEEK